jgi:hypothetical protein
VAALLAEHEPQRSTDRYEHQQQVTALRAEHQQQFAAACAAHEAERATQRAVADTLATQLRGEREQLTTTLASERALLQRQCAPRACRGATPTARRSPRSRSNSIEALAVQREREQVSLHEARIAQADRVAAQVCAQCPNVCQVVSARTTHCPLCTHNCMSLY